MARFAPLPDSIPEKLHVQSNQRRPITDSSLQHTIDHLNCSACLAANERVMNIDVGLPMLSFTQAAERWLEWRRPYVNPNTIGAYNYYLGSLKRFFQALILSEIHAGHLREYQIMRSANQDKKWPRKAGPSVINHELNTLSQILEHAGLWQKLKA